MLKNVETVLSATNTQDGKVERDLHDHFSTSDDNEK